MSDSLYMCSTLCICSIDRLYSLLRIVTCESRLFCTTDWYCCSSMKPSSGEKPLQIDTNYKCRQENGWTLHWIYLPFFNRMMFSTYSMKNHCALNCKFKFIHRQAHCLIPITTFSIVTQLLQHYIYLQFFSISINSATRNIPFASH